MVDPITGLLIGTGYAADQFLNDGRATDWVGTNAKTAGHQLFDPLLKGMGFKAPPPKPRSAALPYNSQLNSGIQSYDRLIGEVESSRPRDIDMRTAANTARRAMATRGIEGPLAGMAEVESQNQVSRAHSQMRREQLGQLLAARQNAVLGIQDREELRRRMSMAMDAYEREKQAAKQASIMQGMLGIPLTLAGLGIGAQFGKPMEGAQIGGTFGQTAGGMLSAMAPDWLASSGGTY